MLVTERSHQEGYYLSEGERCLMSHELTQYWYSYDSLDSISLLEFGRERQHTVIDTPFLGIAPNRTQADPW